MPIAAGAVALSSTTPVSWQAAPASGWQTLRLTADKPWFETVAAENVFVGDPSLLQTIRGQLHRPSAVTVGNAGQIYVTDTGNDRVQVYNSMGSLIASYGQLDDKGHGVIFRKPQGIAVDSYGAMYVADTDAGRVVKFSPLGQILLEIPKLGHPQGVALDAAGNIYASDTDNAQVKKFDRGGALLATFPLPGSKPAGLSVDAAYRLYVADPAKGRVAVFSLFGTLLETIGPAVGLDRPYGVAVSPDGGCLVVSDWRRDRLFKLDALAEPNLVFGGWGSGLKGPRGLAFDRSGALWIAERNHNRLIKLGPPAPGQIAVPLNPPETRDNEVAMLIPANTGGRLARGDRAAITISTGVLSDDLEVSIATPTFHLAQEEEMKERKLSDADLIAVSTGVEFGPDGAVFAAPVTVTLPYDLALVQSAGLPELGLQVYAWDADKQKWRWLPSVVNASARTVSASTTRLTLCRVVGKKPKENAP